ncbi:MAG: hypothetical protein WA982_17085, partial [Rubrobacteraceae bacterium]
LEFVGEKVPSELGSAKSTEAKVLEKLEDTEHLSRDAGLKIVRDACDELEYQVQTLYRNEPAETTKAVADGE